MRKPLETDIFYLFIVFPLLSGDNIYGFIGLLYEMQLFFETHLYASKKKHITLILDDSEFIENCRILVDVTRLRQVLNNLLNNAIKFTQKGYIRFGYRRPTPDKLEFVGDIWVESKEGEGSSFYFSISYVEVA